MSSNNKKQRPGRLRPIKPNLPHQTKSRSRYGGFFVGIAIVLGVALIVYAVTRPKPPPEPAGETPTVSAASPLGGVKPVAPPRSPANLAGPASTPAPPPEGPHFNAGAMVYDFGRAEGGTPVVCQISFTNSGTALLEVTQVSPSCSCMKAGAWTRQVLPGQTGTIAVTIDTSHYTGPFGKSVVVSCNDASQPEARLEIKGFVWRALEIIPPSAVISLSMESPSNNASVRVVSHLDEPVTLSDLQSTLPNLAVDLQTNSPGKEYQINVRPLPPLPTANQQGQITFKTSAAQVPATNINVGVNFLPVLQPFPNMLRLPPVPLSNSVSLMAWVRNNGTNTLVVTEAAVSPPGVEIDSQDDPMNRGQRFTLNFPAGYQLPPGTNSAELVVKTSHPQYPTLRIPIIPSGRR